jgi:hypothetical protein
MKPDIPGESPIHFVQSNLSRLSLIRARTISFLDQTVSRLEYEQERGNGIFFYKIGNQWIVRGVVDYLCGETLDCAVGHIRNGIVGMARAFENGYEFNPKELRNVFLTSLAVSDTATAHFISALPSSIPLNKGIITAQVFTAFAIFRKQQDVAMQLLEALSSLTFEFPIPDDLKRDKLEIQNDYRIFEALCKKKPSGFNEFLSNRMQIIVNSLEKWEINDPLKLLDLSGLGFCRLAHDRGMAITVDHPFLPLAFLDV